MMETVYCRNQDYKKDNKALQFQNTFCFSSTHTHSNL